MEKYNEMVAENPKVEMIHISRDREEDAAENWAAAEGFPWLTILPDDTERSGLMEYRTRNSVPFYTMVDASGKELATQRSVTAYCRIENDQGKLRSGMTGFGRVYHHWRPLGWIGLTRALQFLRTEFWM